MKKPQIKEIALKFLQEKEHITAAVSTATNDGTPHTAVVYYFADEDFNFYFLTADHTTKHENLLKNSKVSIAVGFGPSYVTIQGQGEASLLEKGSDEENQAIANIYNRLYENHFHWPVFQMSRYEKESISVFKIVPSELSMMNLDYESFPAETSDDFYKLI